MWGGGEARRTLRERVFDREVAEVCCDSTLPLLHAVVKWAKAVSRTGDTQDEDRSDWPIVLETNSAATFESVRAFVARVLPTRQVIASTEVDPSKDPLWYPRLLCYDTTHESVYTLRSLVETKQADPAKCCVVFDQKEGVERIKELEERFGRIQALCSAYIYDDILRQIRTWLREGHSADDIQQELDRQYGYLHSHS
jgi:hypothetical protein